MTGQTETHAALDYETATGRNIDLAFTLLRAQIADPALLEQIPDGATLMLIPDDDPELAEHNFALARQLFASGRNVYLYHTPVAGTREPGPAEG